MNAIGLFIIDDHALYQIDKMITRKDYDLENYIHKYKPDLATKLSREGSRKSSRAIRDGAKLALQMNTKRPIIRSDIKCKPKHAKLINTVTVVVTHTSSESK
jgi:hypothetical protein